MLKHALLVALTLVAVTGCSGSGADAEWAAESEELGVTSQAYTPTCTHTQTGIPRRNFYLSNTVNGNGSATITVKNTDTCRTPASVIQTQALCFGLGGLTVVALDPISVPALNAYQSLSWPIPMQPQCSGYTSTVDPQNTVAETNENDNSTSF